MSSLRCTNCRNNFTEEYVPTFLPYCGDTICKPCIINLAQQGEVFKCPLCNYGYKSQTISSFKTNFVLLEGTDSNSSEKEKKSECIIHNKLQVLYCSTCVKLVCTECIVTAHRHHEFGDIEEGVKIMAELESYKKNISFYHPFSFDEKDPCASYNDYDVDSYYDRFNSFNNF